MKNECGRITHDAINGDLIMKILWRLCKEMVRSWLDWSMQPQFALAENSSLVTLVRQVASDVDRCTVYAFIFQHSLLHCTVWAKGTRKEKSRRWLRVIIACKIK
jgi:hypothetical protein